MARAKIPAFEPKNGSGIKLVGSWFKKTRNAREETRLPDETTAVDFECTFLPHMDAAYNLARWLVRDDHDAQDVVQEAYLRALRFAGRFRGGDPRAWILTIVRNAAFTWLRRNRGSDPPAEFDESLHGGDIEETGLEADALKRADEAMIRGALDELAVGFREMIVMRDIEGLSYKEIANVAEVPIGTVMSRLARARTKLARSLKERIAKES